MIARVIVTVLLFAFAAGLAAAFAWYASHGLFARHQGRHADLPLDDRPRRELAAIAAAPDTTAEFESMGRLRGTAGQRAGYWAPRSGDMDWYGTDPMTWNPSTIALPREQTSGPVVEVTDDPPGRHERPRVHPVRSRAQQAMDDDLKAAGLPVYASEDDALEDIWAQAMGAAIAAVEAARKP